MNSDDLSVIPDEVLGLTEQHLCRIPELNCFLHVQVREPLQRFIRAADEAGFSLSVASGFRSFERQLTIWNAKAQGSRPLLDSAGCPLKPEDLSDNEKLWAILRWSALPGASRHHWGSDFDVYDARGVDERYQLQLTPSECSEGGVFAGFHVWLEQQLLSTDTGMNFFKPYQTDTGGVAPEPWHLSYRPIAETYSAVLNIDILRQQLLKTDIALKVVVLDNLEEIYHRFIQIPRG